MFLVPAAKDLGLPIDARALVHTPALQGCNGSLRSALFETLAAGGRLLRLSGVLAVAGAAVLLRCECGLRATLRKALSGVGRVTSTGHFLCWKQGAGQLIECLGK